MRSRRSLSTYWRTAILLLVILFTTTINLFAQQPTILTLNQPINISLSCLEPNDHPKYIYEIALDRGEYMEILCQQMGADIKMTISSPEGKKIAVVDSYSGAYGPECWRGISSSSGRYIVQIEVLSTRGADSKYSLTIPVKQNPTPNDSKRAQAQELYSRAWHFKNGTQRDMDEAYYLYDQAAVLYREAGDFLGEAQTTASSAALGCPTLTKRLKTDLQRSSIDLHRRLRERNGEAIALHSLGEIYAEDNRCSLAISCYREALKAYRELGDSQGEIIALNSLALVYCQVSQYQDALSYLKQALGVCKKACDNSKEALVMRHIGEVYEEMGQESQAAEYFRQAKALVR
ncbi:MAG: tetratricopeptide repeat protein [Acidobacteria bacterium]|nr:tetratricopeptide repeat protein [Acidobacteriota bacterium]